MQNFLFILWYFLPAGLANTAPIFASHIGFLKKYTHPLDGYHKWRGKRIFGNHKTIRGMISGVIVGIIASVLEQQYYNLPFIRTFVPASFMHIDPVMFGILSAIGALGGDSIKSFFKRQLNIASGRSWFPFDQIDYIVGGITLTALVYPLSLWQYLLLFIIWFLLHPISTLVGYWLKLKKSPI